nr:hypothetical protein [Tanacetum cinerariifolium]
RRVRLAAIAPEGAFGLGSAAIEGVFVLGIGDYGIDAASSILDSESDAGGEGLSRSAPS